MSLVLLKVSSCWKERFNRRCWKDFWNKWCEPTNHQLLPHRFHAGVGGVRGKIVTNHVFTSIFIRTSTDTMRSLTPDPQANSCPSNTPLRSWGPNQRSSASAETLTCGSSWMHACPSLTSHAHGLKTPPLLFALSQFFSSYSDLSFRNPLSSDSGSQGSYWMSY